MNITLMLIKPDATNRHLIGAILKMVEDDGFQIEFLKEFYMTDELAAEFYFEHRDKDFYMPLVEFMKSDKIVAAIVSKPDAVHELRKLLGATNPDKAEPGTIRATYGETLRRNSVHGSDSDESARREINLIFPNNKYFPQDKK
ncbi:MAG: nucleoside-diphosphate kinase [Candidatus Cloacimonetes bacterium]|nr:nucleoside-diphosphate kinase [Candidatus Cloacimonadota bacterium]